MLKKLLALALAGFTFLQLTLFMAEKWWFFELFVHYAHYYALLGTALALLALKSGHHRFALIFLSFVSIHLGTLSPYLSKTATPSNETPALTVLSSNFYYLNSDFGDLKTIVDDEQPDLFMIHEAGPQWNEGITPFATDYPYYDLSQEMGVHGIILASKIPGTFQEIPLGTEFGLEFVPEGGNYRILGVHPAAPLTAEWAAERNAQFHDLAEYMRSSEVPTLIMGDFNCTPWSPYLATLMEETGLTDARLGYGIVPTWHAHSPFFKLPIDHALVKGWEVLDFHRTDFIDSDHYPIVVELGERGF